MSPVNATPTRPGTQLTWSGSPRTNVLPTLSESMALGLTHDWGPDNTVQLCTSLDDFVNYYGSSNTAGFRAAVSAFAGQNVPGAGGAGGIYVYRQTAVAGAKATLALSNTTPAVMLTLTATYKGTRGNAISVKVVENVNDSAKHDLSILVDGVVVEVFTFTKTDAAQAASLINSTTTGSRWVTAVAGVTGTALAAIASTPLTGGDDGATLTATEYTAALNAFEFEPFSVLAFANLSDNTIRSSVVAWVQSQATNNRPCIYVGGGAQGEDLATAITRSSGINDEHVVNLGVGTYADAQLGVNVGTAELAPRVAGIIAARGQNSSITFSDIGGLTLAAGTTGLSNSNVVDAIKAGVTVFTRTSSSSGADIHIERGVTSFTSTGITAKPYNIFSDIQQIRVMDIFQRDLKTFGDSTIIGKRLVDDDTRAMVKAEAVRLMNILADDSIIQAGTQYINVTVTDDDTIPFDFGWTPNRIANFLLGSGQIG